MKIFLWDRKDYEWLLFDSEDKNFKNELKKRNIVIGGGASIGNEASIGYGASIIKSDTFSKENIYCQLNLITDKDGYLTMYKAVTPELKDFYTGKYQYRVGKGDTCKAERNQSMQCGAEGWHFTNLNNAISFASGRPNKLISAKIHIDDILSVYDKVRVRKFSNIQVVNLKIS